jgi:hypothetical protein
MSKDWRRGVCPKTGNTVEWFGENVPAFCGEDECKGDGVRPVVNPQTEPMPKDYQEELKKLLEDAKIMIFTGDNVALERITKVIHDYGNARELQGVEKVEKALNEMVIETVGNSAKTLDQALNVIKAIKK